MTQQAKKYKVGIVGCGRQGTQHGRGFNLLPKTEVVAIADPDQDNLELACKRFGARGYSTAEEMYAKEQLDIVDCVLPVQYNPDMVVLAAETSGAKGIVSEKPLSASLADADRMLAACESRGIPWQGGNVDRSISQMWEARAIIEAGEIGEVTSISLHEAILQGGCQGLSVAHMFAQDSDVEWVTGWTNGDPFAAGDDDYKGIGGYIRYANGIECLVHAKSSAASGLVVTGTKGVFVTDKRNYRFYKKVEGAGRDVLSGLQHDESKTAKPFRSHAEGGYDDEGWQYPGDRLVNSMQSIVDAIENGIEPKASGQVQHKSLEVTMAMRESARQGHAQVKLPLQDRSLTIMPEWYRWDNKKGLFGEERYAEEIGRATKD
jgi:predicted dehydrogenase